MQTKGIYLIPFVGGVALSRGKPLSQGAWVFVALAGPLFGFALALVTALGYVMTGWTVLAAAAWWMGLLNLFNLIPIYPLDGGQVMHCIACSVPRPVGIAICGISILLAAGLALFVPLLLGLFILWMALEGFSDFVYGRSMREWQRRTLESYEEGLLRGEVVELLPRVQAKIEELREPVPLSGLGVALSVGSYLLLATALGALFAVTVTVPGAMEGLLRLVGQG